MPSTVVRMTVIAAFAAAVLVVLDPAIVGSAAAAQSVHGAVVAAKTHAPVNGGIVALVDSAGRAVSAALADDSGHYELRAPAAGTFRLRVERVGFRSTLTAPFALAVGESRAYPLEVNSDLVSLGAMRVTAEKNCVVRPGAGLAAAELWNEARKALSATSLAEADRTYTMRLRKSERQLDPTTLVERSATHFEEEGHTASPFVSEPGDSLARYGFVRYEPDGSSSWFAPDADVLLSDRFLDSHCLMAVPISNGLVGLMFEPASARKLPDVKGVLWFDPRTAELRFLQYQYVNLALQVPTEKLGGRIDFTQLPNGRWIVKRWYIRMPELNRERYRPNFGSGATAERVVLSTIREKSAEVLDVEAEGVRAARTTGSIAGSVFDSVRRKPVSGARVFVSGTSRATITDPEGRYRIDSVPPGSHVVSVVLGRLDSLLIEPPAANVVLSAGAASASHFAIPSLATLARERCGVSKLPDESAMIVGVVRDSITGRPAADAVVRATWQEISGSTGQSLQARNVTSEARSSERGGYALCALPLDRPVTVRVLRGRIAGTPRVVRFLVRDVVRLDLLAPPEGAAP